MVKTMKQRNVKEFKQQGAVLVTALVLMAIFTLLGISVMNSNIMDVRIHNAMKDRGNGFQCAEAALRAGEIWLSEVTSRPEETTTPVQSLTAPQVWSVANVQLKNILGKDNNWWTNNNNTWSYGSDLTDANPLVGCAQEPRYIVESLGPIEGDDKSVDYQQLAQQALNVYRITAYSIGVTDSTAVILQSTYLRRFN